jgi:hypothetical protein
MPTLPNRRRKSDFSHKVARASFESLESRRLLTTAVWTGNAGDGLFTTAGNWQGDVAPTSGQSVDFPANAASQTVTINANVSVGEVEFDTSYTLSPATGTSDAMAIDGELTVNAGVVIINNPIQLQANTTFLIDQGAGIQTNAAISDGGGGFGIDLEGGGEFGLAGGGETYTGTTFAGSGILIDTAPLASSVAVASGATFYGSSSAASLLGTTGIISPGTYDSVSQTSSPATITVSDGFSFANPTDTTLAFDLDGPSNSSNFIVTGGTINLNDAALSTAVVDGYTPGQGDVITLIHNDTGSAISGTFLGLAQGANTTIGGVVYTISYTGGSDGRDVTLTAPGTAPNPDILSHTITTSTHGKTIAASVDAVDTSAGGTADLTYTWTTIHAPTGAKATKFSANGTNAASSIIAAFSKDGTYILQCVVKDKSGNTATADTTVTVSQKAHTISITPAGAKIDKKKHEQYTATVLDQFGHAMRAAQTIAYSVPGGDGTIGSTGLFLAGDVEKKVKIEAADGTLAAIVEATIV